MSSQDELSRDQRSRAEYSQADYSQAEYYQTESERNRLLRRADWRYLLDNPWPKTSLCLSDGFLAQAVQAVSWRTIPEQESLPGECDLVAVINPSSSGLKKAWQALCDKGSFYSEWYSPFAGGTKEIRNRLEAAGFSDVTCYFPWPIPAFAPALFWLPLDASLAIQYYLSSRPRRLSLFGRFTASVMPILWNFLKKAGLIAPICVTARKANSASASDQPKVGTIMNCGDGNNSSSSHRFDKIMWTGGHRSINKVILYLFEADEDQPKRIVKLPRIPEAVPAIIHEAQILQALHERTSLTARDIPEVLCLHELNGWVTLEETLVSGQILYTVLDMQTAQALAIQVTGLLARLVDDKPQASRSDWWDRLVEPALDDFEHAFAPVLDETVVPKCRGILERLGDLPRAFEHRDCAPWNVLVKESGELAILDWESAEQYGLPALDLNYFLAYLAFFIDGAMENRNFSDSYRRAADPATFTGRIQADCQQRYIESTGLDPLMLYPLRILTWLIHARVEVRHLAADAAGSPRPDALLRSLFYNLILEELAANQIWTQAD